MPTASWLSALPPLSHTPDVDSPPGRIKSGLRVSPLMILYILESYDPESLYLVD